MTSLLEEALKEVGYTELPVNRTKYAAEAGHAQGQPWCATFVVAMARRARVQLPNESAYTPTLAQGFRSEGRYNRTPQVGAVCFFDFPDSTTRIQHVGIVERFTSTTVTCVEGNTSAGNRGSQDNGGGVYVRTRNRTHVAGFGHLIPSVEEPDLTDDQDARLIRLEQAVDRVADDLDRVLDALAGWQQKPDGTRDTTRRSLVGRIGDAVKAAR